MKKIQSILITAYAVDPYKGSEDGTGWNICKQLARRNKVIVITRKNNREAIEKYMKSYPDNIYSNMRFAYFDLPNWAMSWKKKIGERGYVLYFQLWQIVLPLYIWRHNFHFDIIHNLNFHSDSHTHFLWVFGKATVWGPIGHHPAVPEKFLKEYGKGALVKDRLYAVVKWMMKNLNPFYRLALKKTDLIFVINSSINKHIKADPKKVVVLPAVAADWPLVTKRDSKKFRILSIGRFVPMKGFDIAIKSFVKFYNGLNANYKELTELVLVGKGEQEGYFKELVKLYKVEHCVRFVSWVDKEEVTELYSNSKIFLFPSHEGAGMVIPEAMSHGLPIVCFDNVGPGELANNAALKIPYMNYSEVITSFSKALTQLFFDKSKYKELSSNSLYNYYQNFTWERKGQIIQRAYRNYLP